MADFGFSISKTRSINLSKSDLSKYEHLLELVPSFKRCISCGCCTASCSARQFTDFNIRKTLRVMPILTSIGLLTYALVPSLCPDYAYLGLVIGTVEQIGLEPSGISSYAVVRPAVDFSHLTAVFVVKDFTLVD